MTQLMLASLRSNLPLPRCCCCHLVNETSTRRQLHDIPGKRFGGFLSVVAIVTPEPLAYFQQLRLYILRVQGTHLGPDSPVKENKGLVPSPDG